MAHVATRFPDFTDPIVNNGSILVSVKQALQKVFRAVTGKNVFNGNSTTFSSTTAVPVSGLTFNVRAGRQYRISGVILPTSDGTSGMKLGLSLNGSSAATGVVNYMYSTAAATATQQVASNCLGSNSTGVAAAELEVDINGWFIPDVSGAVSLVAGTFTGTTSGTINPGSWLSVIRVKG